MNTLDELLNIILSEDYKHLADNRGLPVVPSDAVYKDISNRMNQTLKPKYIYVMCKQNRYDIWKKVLDFHNIQEDLSFIDLDASTESNSNNVIRFNVTLSHKEWIQIKPENVEYANNKGQSRMYSTLQRKVWSDVLFAAIYKEVKLPCPFAFKRCKVSEQGLYLKMSGSCSECQAKFVGCIINKPLPQSEVVFECEVEGFVSTIKHNKRRQLKGSRRIAIAKTMVDNKTLPSMWRRAEADNLMEIGDPEPPHLPKPCVLRKAKEQLINKNLEITSTDPVNSILQMKYKYHPGSIHSIGLDPFFVHYWTVEQTAVYIQYYRRIFIDATGSLVKKLRTPDGNLCPHIYLYQIVAETPTSKMPVFQMLSSTQNTNAIQNWLYEIIRLGSIHTSKFPLPQEVTCDFDKALLGAITRVFAQCKNLKDYLSKCFLCLSNESLMTLPRSFVRLDICHYMHFVSRWKPLKSLHPQVKTFYLLAMGQLTNQIAFENFKVFVKHLLILCYAQTCGLDEYGQKTIIGRGSHLHDKCH